MFAEICSVLSGSSWCPDANSRSRSAPASAALRRAWRIEECSRVARLRRPPVGNRSPLKRLAKASASSSLAKQNTTKSMSSLAIDAHWAELFALFDHLVSVPGVGDSEAERLAPYSIWL
jgi:hypothetical protein